MNWLTRVKSALHALPGDTRGQTAAAKAIGKGLMVFALVIVILNEFLTIDTINNSTGPFGTDQLVAIGEASIAIGVLGILVMAGAFAMRFMDF